MERMSIKYLAHTLLAAALLLSCNRELQEPVRPNVSPEQVTSVVHYRVTVGEGPVTRASMNNLNQYIFESGDQLYVVDAATNGDNMYGILNLVAGAGDINATFEGDLMCLNNFDPTDATSLSATLVSRSDKIHQTSNGKIDSTVYPSSGADAYAATFTDAIRYFSDFTAQNSFGAHHFSLEQNSTFLIVSVTFNDTDAAIITASGSNDITAIISNNGSTLRSGTVSVEEIDFSKQANFVAALPPTSLQDAEISFTASGGADITSFDDIKNASLQANRYYEISRTNVDLTFFTVQAKTAGTTVVFNYNASGNGIQFKEGPSGTWTDYDNRTITLANEKDYVQFRGKRTTYNTNNTPIITANKTCYIYGDIMSLCCEGDYAPKTTVPTKAFQFAFKGADYIDIPAGRPLKLSASTLGTYCYNQMFDGCTSLSRAPELQTTLSANVPNWAYAYMFQGCTALVSAPELPNATVGTSGYQGMFKGCTSLTTAPATIVGTSGSQACQEMFSGCTSLANAPVPTSSTVGSKGYLQMFLNCTSLVQAPALDATNIGTYAYNEMFKGCTSLISTPESLPATTLADYCYKDMFIGCVSLSQTMSTLPATVSNTSCYQGMFKDCISLNQGPVIMLQDIKGSSCRQMYDGCTSLVTATGLDNLSSSGTIGANGCYQMFRNCGELSSTPNTLKPETLSSAAYYQMYYNCAKITVAPEIHATTVGTSSCEQMFYGCKRLRTAPPSLSVSNVVEKAFKGMFTNCTSLVSTPDFTGMTTVGVEGCMNMFLGCTNLTSSTDLPATSLGTSAYNSMFKNTGLKSAPSLPATTLATTCYQSMMEGCKDLEGPVLLPAPTLVTSCYTTMFKGASKLNSVVCLATSGISTDNCSNWLQSVSSTGTFVRPYASRDSWTLNSASGIPTGWIVKDSGIDPIFDGNGAFDPEEQL